MLGILIINYKKYELTIDCVNSIFDTVSDLNFKIYILDNCSENESFEKLKKQFEDNEKIVLVDSQKNLGYANGNNLLIELAKKDGCEKLLVANNDIIFHKNCINQLCKTQEEKNCLLVGPKLEGTNTNSIKPFRLNFIQYIMTNTYCYNLLSKKQIKKYFHLPNETSKVYWISGCCFLADTKQFEKIGFFDKHTFLYYEEFILSEKAFNNNLSLYFEPKAVVTHYHGASTNGSANIFTRIENFKSETYFLRKIKRYNKFKLYIIRLIRYLEVYIAFKKENNFEAIKQFKVESKRIIKQKEQH